MSSRFFFVFAISILCNLPLSNANAQFFDKLKDAAKQIENETKKIETIIQPNNNKNEYQETRPQQRQIGARSTPRSDVAQQTPQRMPQTIPQRGVAQVATTNQSNNSEQEYELAFENAFGVQLELVQPNPRSKLGESITTGSVLSIEQLTSDGLAASVGVTKGNVLTHLNGVLITGPDVFKQQSIDFLCNRIDSIEFGMLRPIPMSFPSQTKRTLRSQSNISAPASICNVKVARLYKDYGEFSAHDEFVLGKKRFYIRPNTSGNNGDIYAILDKVEYRLNRECGVAGCELFILDNSDTPIAKYHMSLHTGSSSVFYDLDKKETAYIGKNYQYDALAHLVNLSSNDIELIKLTNRYERDIARLYYWFGLYYGDKCQSQIQELEEIRLSTIEKTTDEFGNSRVVNQQESVYPVEKDFASRLVDYGNWYVYGLAEYRVQEGISMYFSQMGCASSAIMNTRKNLLRFGLNHKQINAHNGF